MIGPSSTIESLRRVPSAPVLLARAMWVRKPSIEEPLVESHWLRVNGVKAASSQLERFRSVCQFGPSNVLPITYPQVMSTALQIQLMLRAEFPFSPLGSIHLRNQITQWQTIDQSQPLDFEVGIDAQRITHIGYEIDFVSRALAHEECVWQVVATVLFRRKVMSAPKPKREHTAKPALANSVKWSLPEDLGRAYARASGDYNPIHLMPATARMMGFKRHIAHGMWSKSRCLASLLPQFGDRAVVVETAFKLPVYLPTEVTMMHEVNEDVCHFELRGPNGRRPHLIGSISSMDSR